MIWMGWDCTLQVLHSLSLRCLWGLCLPLSDTAVAVISKVSTLDLTL